MLFWEVMKKENGKSLCISYARFTVSQINCWKKLHANEKRK